MRKIQRCGFGTLFVLLVCALFLPTGRAKQAEQAIPTDLVVYPELIVHNAKIATMDDYGINTSIGTVAEALAVRYGKVWKLGKNDEILKYAGPKTVRVDAKGRTVIPGIIDAHIHIHDIILNDWIAENPNSVAVKVFQVKGETVEEIRKNVEVLIKERMGDVALNQWTFFNLPQPPFGSGGGPGFDFLRQRIMTAQDIDKLAKSPVILAAHPAYVINAAAQNALKTMYDGEPAGYPEDWDDKGFADLGVEYRREVVVDGYFRDKTDQLKEILLRGMLENAVEGITTFSSHITGIQFFDAYMRLYREKRFPIRFGFTHYMGFQLNKDAKGFYRRLGDMFQMGDDYFWFQAIGLGQLDHGPPLFCSSIVPQEERDMYQWCRYGHDAPNYETVVTALANGNRVVAGHNYGDLSADYFMDAIEEAMRRNREITLDHIRSLRLSMDHGGLYPRPDQLPRMKKLGMILSMDASPMGRSLPWIQRWGFEKYQGWVVPVKSALEAGVKVAWEGERQFGEHVFEMMTSFITRKSSQGVVIAPDQAIDRNTVLKMATAWGSEFMLKEKVLGSLEPGKFADLLVLNQDYFTVPVEEIDKTLPLMTVVGGKIIYLQEDFAKELGMTPLGPRMKERQRIRFDGSRG